MRRGCGCAATSDHQDVGNWNSRRRYDANAGALWAVTYSMKQRTGLPGCRWCGLKGSARYATPGWLAIILPTHVVPERCEPVTRIGPRRQPGWHCAVISEPL